MNSKMPSNLLSSTIIVAFSFITHGLLLLNDGVYWDGWLIYTNLINSNWNNLISMFNEAGLPQLAYFHWVFGLFHNIIFSYKLVAFISLTLSGVLIYFILEKPAVFNHDQRIMISLISLSYPAFQVSIELIMIPYLICYCLFLLGWFIVSKSPYQKRLVQCTLRPLSLIIFFISFTIHSLLVYFYAFFLVFFIVDKPKKQNSFRGAVVEWLRHNWDLALLPIIYWVLRNSFFTPSGLYQNYHKISLSPALISDGYRNFFRESVYTQVYNSLSNLIDYPLFSVVVLMAVIMQWKFSIFSWNSVVTYEKKQLFQTICYGIILLLFGIFPYAVTGNKVSAVGWTSRHALLVALPVAIILVAGAWFAAGIIFPKFESLIRHFKIDNGDVVLKLTRLIISIFVLSFMLSTIVFYINWQARWIKDRSIMLKLPYIENFEKFSTFWVKDKFLIYSEHYRYYEWSSIFKKIYGDESRIGIDYRYINTNYLTKYQPYINALYNLKDYDPKGCEAILTIEPGIGVDVNSFLGYLKLSLRYFMVKFFFCDKLEQFLIKVTHLQIKPVSKLKTDSCFY